MQGLALYATGHFVLAACHIIQRASCVQPATVAVARSPAQWWHTGKQWRAAAGRMGRLAAARRAHKQQTAAAKQLRTRRAEGNMDAPVAVPLHCAMLIH
jgi:hypothetical protein